MERKEAGRRRMMTVRGLLADDHIFGNWGERRGERMVEHQVLERVCGDYQVSLEWRFLPGMMVVGRTKY